MMAGIKKVMKARKEIAPAIFPIKEGSRVNGIFKSEKIQTPSSLLSFGLKSQGKV